MTVSRLLSVSTSIVLLWILSGGCITPAKIERSIGKKPEIIDSYFAKNPDSLARRCVERFPTVPKRDTLYLSPDSTGFNEAYINTILLLDSTLKVIDSLRNLPVPEKVNLDSLRKDLAKSLRFKLIPCVDTPKIIKEIVLDSARIFHYESQIRNLSHLLDSTKTLNVTLNKEIKDFKSDKKSIGTVFSWLLFAFATKWWFWLIVILLLAYVTRGIWIRFLPPGLSFIPKAFSFISKILK